MTSSTMPFSYSRESFSQESLGRTGVFAPRQPFSEQVNQLRSNTSITASTTSGRTTTTNKYPSSDLLASSSSPSSSRSNSTSSLVSSSTDSSTSWDDTSSFYESAYPTTANNQSQKAMLSTSTCRSSSSISLGCRDEILSAHQQQLLSAKVTLSTLPFEIRHLVAQECLQADAFHLCLTSRALYESTVSRLYQCIVFDSAHRHFNKEVFYKRLKPSTTSSTTSNDNDDYDNYGNNTNNDYISYTSVRTVGGLRGCMRTLKSDNLKASYVRRFECLNSMDLPDLEIRAFVQQVFPRMPNLVCLVWDASPEITVDLIQHLACPQQMQTLCLDLALRNDAISRSITSMAFPVLTHLTIRPYLSSEFLILLARMVANSEHTVRNLRSLYLGRELHNSHEVGSGFAFASMNPQNPQGGNRVVDDLAVPSFFGTLMDHMPGHTKLRLKQLGLDGITVHYNDFDTLERCVDFSSITHLYLAGTDVTGAAEHVGHENVNGGANNINTAAAAATRTDQRFLPPMAALLTSLQSLEVEWSEEIVDSVPLFISSLPRGLRALSVKIRWNSSKAQRLQWASLCLDYTESIVSRHSVTLRQLALDAVEDMAFYNPFKIIPGPALLVLCGCRRLFGLSIAAPPPLSSQILDELLGSLAQLRFFHLRNQRNKPYLGQNVSYLIEDWLRYKHIVERFTVAQLPSTALEFIKLEDYVFDVRTRQAPAVIREGLLLWFDEQVFEAWEV